MDKGSLPDLSAQHDEAQGIWRVYVGGKQGEQGAGPKGTESSGPRAIPSEEPLSVPPAIPPAAQELLSYSYLDPSDPAPAFTRVTTPAGVDVALYRPWDHVWHTGLFFNWKYVNRHNFWEAHFQHKEPSGRSKSVEFRDRSSGGKCGFHQRITWVTEDGRVLMDEHRCVEIKSEGENGYVIDFAAEFKAVDRTVELDVTKVTDETPWGGYAGFSCRLGRNFTKMLITTDQGEMAAKDAHGKKFRWCDASGWIDGYRDRWAGITIMDHPHNPRHPSHMLTYDTDIQFVQAGLVYKEPYVIDPDQPLHLRYLAYIHDNRPDADELNALWARFSDTE